MAGKGLTRLLTRDKLTQGIAVSSTADGLRSTCTSSSSTGSTSPRSRRPSARASRYEVERLTGLRVAAVEVHIEDVRRSA